MYKDTYNSVYILFTKSMNCTYYILLTILLFSTIDADYFKILYVLLPQHTNFFFQTITLPKKIKKAYFFFSKYLYVYIMSILTQTRETYENGIESSPTTKHYLEIVWVASKIL